MLEIDELFDVSHSCPNAHMENIYLNLVVCCSARSSQCSVDTNFVLQTFVILAENDMLITRLGETIS